MKAKDLTEKQQDDFVEAFYWVANFDDLVEGDHSPWGCPWCYDGDVELVGDSVADMARNYHESVKDEVERVRLEYERELSE